MPYGAAVLMDRMMSSNPAEAWTAYAEDVQKTVTKSEFKMPMLDREAFTDATEQYIEALEKTSQSIVKNAGEYNMQTLDNVREVMSQTREAVKTLMETRDLQSVSELQEDYAEFLLEAVVQQTVLNYQQSGKFFADILTPWSTLARRTMKTYLPGFGA